MGLVEVNVATWYVIMQWLERPVVAHVNTNAPIKGLIIIIPGSINHDFNSRPVNVGTLEPSWMVCHQPNNTIPPTTTNTHFSIFI